MPEYLVDKTKVVTGVAVVTELSTGNLAYQVSFGEYVKNSPEIVNRLPANVRGTFTGDKIAINEIMVVAKMEEVPYKVGSKWRFQIQKNGTLTLVEVE